MRKVLKYYRPFLFILILGVLFSCDGNPKKGTSEKDNKVNEVKNIKSAVSQEVNFSELSKSVFKIQTYQGERLLETGQGFNVTSHLLVAPFSLFKNADRAVLTPLNGGEPFEVTRYMNFDRISNLIIMYADSVKSTPLKFYTGSVIVRVKTLIIGKKSSSTLPLYTGSCLEDRKIQGLHLFTISNKIQNSYLGAPVFVSTGRVLGMATTLEVANEKTCFALPAVEINALISKGEKPELLAKIGNPDSKRNSSIKKIVLDTDYGEIDIRLYNETPAYRDNFVELAKEGYYDGLLIHRVIRDFGIQTGAADTRFAAPDDIVGWKGPGYTIPAHIVPSLYHKRGAIGSPRKPDTKNHERRSDGSQFYIVTGRKYLDDELDDIEKENGIKFTPEQREVYKTVGGAPHLDGQYTVFGKVISGLDVADRISLLPTKTDFRPLQDIRLKKVTIVY